MVSADDSTEAAGDADAQNKDLEEQFRKGVVGLDYLTGAKKNTGETFYDAHPVQAVTTDLLKNSPAIGATLGLAALATNLRRQAKNFHETEPASMSRMGNPGVDATHPGEMLNPTKGKPMRSDMAALFGDPSIDPKKRLEHLDRLGKTDFAKRYTEGMPKEELKKLLGEAHMSPGGAALERYADLQHTLESRRTKGKLRPYLGEKLRNLLGKDSKVQKWLNKHVLPGEGQALADLLEHRGMTGASDSYSPELVKGMGERYFGDKGKFEDFVKNTLPRISDPKHQSSNIRKILRQAKLPLGIAAATTAGGVGLYHLLKAIQNNVYSDEQTKDWKKTLLQSKGEFDKAERVK
jgi:hypothetical protein